ncbi:1-(5-phosphoribosyl)-5-[(5-phosphoribosylamino)methylideneamino] imidazole-4-carboxamide isomerase [Teratosphaeria destructans]|uniref:1-(5-phosphoribosyl)-5-[(5-phosphoribosylamino)methylideneamino] imidazole-4-carboxamide isomerase n=1 Tax=Teratosphaeria destructans TaxID=418781 RepID=A0A9W7W2Y0_9PEZI|nr:1-(5-phosphoribosyl)-5-[(5-phosphoribosylamino)methylideneamino] imidazole-4-carboxamide isomerase [Teratosphaeria destructans]
MTRFRPCIDLHAGSVKQIVGGTLSTDNASLKTNFTSEHPSAYFADLYRKNNLRGGHVIMLGPATMPQPEKRWLRGRKSVLKALDGDSSKLVIDLSCRRVGEGWRVAMDKWQKITEFEINRENIALLEPYCSEFLIHAADAEGLQAGIDEELVSHLAEICTIHVTYAGGGRNLQDLELVERLSGGQVDLTIGSALDIFGGKGVAFEECCEWNRKRDQAS